MDYQHFHLHVRQRQAEMRAASEHARLLRSVHASRRPAEWSPRFGVARALHAIASRLTATSARAS